MWVYVCTRVNTAEARKESWRIDSNFKDRIDQLEAEQRARQQVLHHSTCMRTDTVALHHVHACAELLNMGPVMTVHEERTAGR